MTKTILSEMDGFTPLPELLIRRYGLQTAAVFGQVWRYCQMKHGTCTAAQNRIARDLCISRATVNREIKALCADGFLQDLTPDLRNQPHTYADTGKVAMYNKFGMQRDAKSGVTDSSSSASESYSGVTDSHSGCNSELHEDSIKKEFKRITHTPEKPDFINLTVKEVLSLKEIQIFRDTTGRVPREGQWETVYTVIRQLNGNGTPEKLHPYWLEWCGRGFRPDNLGWLTDWAINNAIPPVVRLTPRPNKQKSTIEILREIKDGD